MWPLRVISAVTAVIVLFGYTLTAQAQGNSGRPASSGSLPVVVGKGSLTVAGKGYWHRQTLEDGDNPSISPYDSSGQVLPDGVYRYEFRTFPNRAASPRQQDLLRAKGSGLTPSTFRGSAGETLSGRFEIEGGQLIFR